MARKPSTGLTDAEHRIMNVLWDLSEATVGDVVERIEGPSRPAYNTVLTLLRILERKGYRVLEAPNAAEAIAAAAKPTQLIDLVISDMVMPGMSGLELRQRLRELRPTVPVLLMSGYSEEAITRLGSLEPVRPLIEKPFTVHGILAMVQDALTAQSPDA